MTAVPLRNATAGEGSTGVVLPSHTHEKQWDADRAPADR